METLLANLSYKLMTFYKGFAFIFLILYYYFLIPLPIFSAGGLWPNCNTDLFFLSYVQKAQKCSLAVQSWEASMGNLTMDIWFLWTWVLTSWKVSCIMLLHMFLRVFRTCPLDGIERGPGWHYVIPLGPSQTEAGTISSSLSIMPD